jgi:hypothetical protein
VPEKAGHSGAWQLTSTNAFALIESMFAAGQTEMTVSPVYTAKSYTVFFPSEEKSAAFGSDVTVAITAKPGYTVQKIDCINMNTGATIELTNGKFQMPDANVKIVVTETPNVLNYKLVDGNAVECTPEEIKTQEEANKPVPVEPELSVWDQLDAAYQEGVDSV